MCPLKYFRILFAQMCLLKTRTNLICGTQVSFAATLFKILIREETENTGFSTKTRKINMEDMYVYMLYCVQGSHSHSLYLIYALLSRTQPCRDYAHFGGHFWPKSGGRGHKNILYGWEVSLHRVY